MDDFDRAVEELINEVAKAEHRNILDKEIKRKLRLRRSIERGFDILSTVPEEERDANWHAAYERNCFFEVWLSHYAEMKFRKFQAKDNPNNRKLSEEEVRAKSGELLKAVFGDSTKWAEGVAREVAEGARAARGVRNSNRKEKH